MSVKVTSVCFAVMWLSVSYITYNVDSYEFYRESLQGPIFSGFLALGGFLLSLKTFILVKLNEGVFESSLYRKRHMQNCERNPGHVPPLYSPLKNLSDFLIWSVAFCVFTAALQLTLGFVNHFLATSTVIAFALQSIYLVFRSWWEIKGNLETWIELLQEAREIEEEAEAKRDP